ncbi:MAG: RidA family protein [Gammaproteobacteria bacterium]|nr:RidA family protein [Gammaproteobacteria bacterium]
MAKIETKLKELGIELPAPIKLPPGLTLPFSFVKTCGNRAYLSGHAPLNLDGSLAEPLGKVGAEVSVGQATELAKLTAVAMLSSLRRELGDLDRVTNWLRVLGMVNVAPGFNMTTPVVNGFSELIVEVYGPERGSHTRSAVGMAVLPLDIAVEVEAEVEIAT